MPDLGLNVLLKGKNMARLLGGLWVALRISLLSVAVSIPLGILLGVLMSGKNPVVKAILRVYLEIIRIMPQMVLLFLVFFGTTRAWGWDLSGETASVIVFVLWGTAEMSDLVRGALISIPKHQYESSEALGLTKAQTYWYIIIPQTVRRLIPLSINLITRMIKTTSLVLMIGVVEVINRNQESINKKAGEEINIKYVLDLRDFPGDPIQEKIVHDFDVILNDPEIKIVVEVMGGVEPAYTFTKKALLAGKSVCTSNKELVARHGAELLEIARERNINYLFEASCGGGIPIIRPLNSSLTADEIDEITGILNGTTNYILTEMAEKGSDFADVLKEAQNLGYAERNPEADVEGYDACRKIAILSSLAFGRQVDYEDIYTEGISKITATDIKYAKAMGQMIKLLAVSRKVDGSFYAMVSPVLVGPSDPLYSVNGVFNAIFVHGNVLGDAMFYGSGAGKLPTASAVVADVVDEARHLNRSIMAFWSSKKLELTDISNSSRKFFVRVKGTPETELAKVQEVFGNVQPVVVADVDGEFGFVTEVMTEAEYKAKAESFGEVLGMIRVRRVED